MAKDTKKADQAKLTLLRLFELNIKKLIIELSNGNEDQLFIINNEIKEILDSLGKSQSDLPQLLSEAKKIVLERYPRFKN